jgi:primosomal protein N'
MTDWTCSECDWWLSVDATDEPPLRCHNCGARTEPITDPDSLIDAETKTDKI